jgi:hypothetical protein
MQGTVSSDFVAIVRPFARARGAAQVGVDGDRLGDFPRWLPTWELRGFSGPVQSRRAVLGAKAGAMSAFGEARSSGDGPAIGAEAPDTAPPFVHALR